MSPRPASEGVVGVPSPLPSEQPKGARLAVEALMGRHRMIDAPMSFSLLGREWSLLPDVYAPYLTRCAALYAEWLPYPFGGAFCEIGCGTGYLAVTAAERGCARVMATDLNPVAVENTRLNAERHGFSDRVRTACGDMFKPLAPGDLYDLVFWNSSFVNAEPDGALGLLERAFLDPGYEAHARFLAGARDVLKPGGLLLMGYSNMGDSAALHRLAAQHGWGMGIMRLANVQTAMGENQHQLLRFDDLSAFPSPPT